jgi:transcriptional regulator with XRE-family HTH domain
VWSEVGVVEREWTREVRRALGERLKREATARGVAQRDIASALGLSQSHVSRTFSGKNKSEGIYSRVATQIGVSVEELREELESRIRANARALSREERERVGALLVARAKAQGVTQGELAAHLGVSRNTLRRVLNGATRKRARYEEVALALRWSLSEALERAESGALTRPSSTPGALAAPLYFTSTFELDGDLYATRSDGATFRYDPGRHAWSRHGALDTPQ